MRLLILILYCSLSAISLSQYVYTPSTFYIIPPTSGCNGVWAMDGSDIVNGSCGGSYSWDPCAEFSHFDGDTMFFNLCSVPCYFIVVDDSGYVCMECPLYFSTSTPEIDPMPDASACDYYILPPITGNQLTGNEAYFEGSQGTGVSYLEGDTIWSSMLLYIFDQNIVNCYNCVDEESFNMSVAQTMGLDSIYTTPSSGAGVADACITGVDANGTGPWTYTIDGNSVTLPDCNLLAGEYEVCAQSASGCLSCGSVVIASCEFSFTLNTALSGCDYPCNGVIILNGNPGMMFSVDSVNWASNGTITGLCPGETIVYVMNSYGCVTTDTVIIATANPNQPSIQPIQPFATPTMCTGELQAIPSGGVPPYFYKWTECDGEDILGTNEILNNLCPGSYKVEVTDSRSCPVTTECDTIFNSVGLSEQYILDVEVFPNPNTGKFELLDQNGSKTVVEQVTILDPNGKVVYENSIQNEIDISHVEKGIYILKAKIKGEIRIIRFVVE